MLSPAGMIGLATPEAPDETGGVTSAMMERQ